MAKAPAAPTTPAAAAVGNPGVPMPPTLNKSYRAPAVTTSTNVGKWMAWIALGIAAAVCIIVIASLVRRHYEQKQVEKEMPSIRGVICPDVSAHETRECLIGEDWSNDIKIADGPESNGMQVCALPSGAVLGKTYERTDRKGTTFWRFRTEGGTTVKSYRLFPPDQVCPLTL